VKDDVATDVSKGRSFGPALKGFPWELQNEINKDWVFFLVSNIKAYLSLLGGISIKSVTAEKVSPKMKKFVVVVKSSNFEGEVSVDLLCTNNLRIIDVVVQGISLLSQIKLQVNSILNPDKKDGDALSRWRKYILGERAKNRAKGTAK
jgi:hypothetical protein